MQVFQFPVAKYFAAGAFLMNLHCCIYGSETAAYFNCVTPEDGHLTLQQYLSLVVDDDEVDDDEVDDDEEDKE
jgi:hypothetical protein